MNHHTWVSKQLIAPLALLLAVAPALKAAKSSSRFHADGKTGSIARVSPSPASADPNSAAQGVAGQTVPRPSPAGGEPEVKAPQVTYEDGQLTVIAENSSLSDVMKALREVLGADIDLPAKVVDQHIWVHLGPGPASRVLRDLLDGTEFNYVIQASESDPDGVRSVLLTPRGKSGGSEPAGPPERAAIRRMPGSTDPENPSPEPVASVDPQQPTSPASPANGSPNVARVQDTLGNSGSSAARPAPPTDPNQQIQLLQSMYQQRRQLQMQQNQKAAGQN